MIVFDAEKQRQARIMQSRARANKNKPEHNKGGLNSKDFESVTGTVTLEQLKH